LASFQASARLRGHGDQIASGITGIDKGFSTKISDKFNIQIEFQSAGVLKCCGRNPTVTLPPVQSCAVLVENEIFAS